MSLKRQTAEIVGAKETAAVTEQTFTILKFEAHKGAQLGDYEVAYEQNNIPEKWASAFNVLRQNNATIKSRYHGTGYNYCYWLYGAGRIYRQKLVTKQKDA